LIAETSGEAEYYIINPHIEKILTVVAKCESEAIHERWGDCDKSGIENEKHCKAYGILQFHQETFDWMTKLFHMTDLNRMNKEHQIKVGRRAFQSKKLSKHWTCWRKHYN